MDGTQSWSFSGAPDILYLINPRHIFNLFRRTCPERVKGCTLITHLSLSKFAPIPNPYNPTPPNPNSHSLSCSQTAGATGYQRIEAGM